MQNTVNRKWNRPALKNVGTLRDVAGSGAAADQSSGNSQGAGNSRS